ncbi:MAG: DUF4124 domain-containing protein [Bacteroidota bacterium]
MTRSALALIFATLALPAAAQTIYRCSDANGGVVISNTRLEKSCKAIVSGPDSSLPAPKPRAAGAAATPTPAGFPKVQDETQKSRDGDRRHILEQELAAEQRSLEQSRKDLAEQERLAGGNAERLAPFKDSVAQHERNIAAVQKELSGLR